MSRRIGSVVAVTVAGLTCAAPGVSAQIPGKNGKIVFQSDRAGGLPQIYTMDADGSAITRLTNNTAADRTPGFSPDGTKIAFFSDRDDVSGDVWLMDADGSNQTRLTAAKGHDGLPAFSPDGSRIAFTSERDENAGEIYTMAVDGTDVKRVTNSPGVDSQPAFSPDGSRIAFISQRDGNDAEIYTMATDGTDVQRLTNDPAEQILPAYSPDGATIAYTSDASGANAIWTMHADGSNEAQLTFGTALSDLSPKFSPDGEQLVFTRAGNVELLALADLGETPIGAVGNGGNDGAPDWQWRSTGIATSLLCPQGWLTTSPQSCSVTGTALGGFSSNQSTVDGASYVSTVDNPAGVTISGEGDHVVAAWTTDASFLDGPLEHAHVKIDLTDPAGGIATLGASCHVTWNGVHDALSGIDTGAFVAQVIGGGALTWTALASGVFDEQAQTYAADLPAAACVPDAQVNVRLTIADQAGRTVTAGGPGGQVLHIPAVPVTPVIPTTTMTTTTPTVTTTTPVPTVPIPPVFTMTGVRLSSSSIAPKRKATLSFTLSVPTKVTLALSQVSTGRRSGKKCVKATSRNHTRKSCALATLIGTVVVNGRAGGNISAITNRFAKHLLKPGRYKLVVTAAFLAGTGEGPGPQSKTLSLTVKKR